MNTTIIALIKKFGKRQATSEVFLKQYRYLSRKDVIEMDLFFNKDGS